MIAMQGATRQLLIPMAAVLIESEHVPATLRCLGCGGALDLHQPSPDLPDRLIGDCHRSCDGCGAWHVINRVPGESGAVIVLLPTSRAFREAFAAAGPASCP